MTLPAVYSPQQVADHMGVDKSTIYRAIERGELAATRIGTKRVLRVTEAAVLRWLGEDVDTDPTPSHGTVRPAVSA